VDAFPLIYPPIPVIIKKIGSVLTYLGPSFIVTREGNPEKLGGKILLVPVPDGESLNLNNNNSTKWNY